MNLYSHRKVTPYFVPLQTFSYFFLQLVATNTSTGDKSRQLPQKLTYQDEYFIFFLKIFLSFKNNVYFVNFITATRVKDPAEFTLPKYRKI